MFGARVAVAAAVVAATTNIVPFRGIDLIRYQRTVTDLASYGNPVAV